MRFVAFARQIHSALTLIVRRVPRAFTLIDRLFVYRASYRETGDYSAGFDRIRLELAPLEARAMLSGTPVPNPIIFAAAAGQVSEYAAATGDLNFSITPYSGYSGPINVATGDLNGDGFPDLVTAEGAGGEPLVRVFDGVSGTAFSGAFGGFLAFEPSYTGGVQVAVADVDGDGVPDIVAAAERAAGPEIRVFSGANGDVLADFTVTGAAFASGFSLAAGDFTGSGKADVVVGGAGGWVSVIDPLSGAPLSGTLGSFQAFGSGYTGGVVSVAADPQAGVVNPGATSELVVATGAGPVTEVKVFDATGAVLQDIQPFGASDTVGAQVALAYVSNPTAPTVPDVVIGSGAGDTDTAVVFSGTTGAQLAGAAGAYTLSGTDTSGVVVAADNDPFIATFVTSPSTQTVSVGATASETSSVSLTAASGLLAFTVSWGDGTTTAQNHSYSPGVTSGFDTEAHSYTTAGTYTVTSSVSAYNATGTFMQAESTTVVVDVVATSPPPPTLASIGTYAWYDTNDNGATDTGEPAAPGVTVALTGGGLTAAETAITSASGQYNFPNLQPNTYTVSFTAPAGYGISTPSGGKTVQTVTAGEADTVADAGVFLLPTVHFASATGSIYETGGDELVTVDLSASISQTVLVNYSTSNGTALSGVNYTATSGTLTFTPGETSTSFAVPILNNHATGTYPATFKLSLSSPTNATIGALSTETVSINDLTWTGGPTDSWSQTVASAPSVTALGSHTNTEGDTVSLSVGASAAGGYTLSYAAVDLPPGLSINSSTGLISGTIADGDWEDAEALGGSFEPTVIVTAANATLGAASSSTSFNWAISDTLPTPVVTSPGAQTGVIGATVSLQVTATQADGDELVYDATGLPDGLSIDPDAGLISGTIAPDAASGTAYTVTVTATDYTPSTAEVGSQTFVWTVGIGTPSVSLASPGNQSNVAGDNVSLALTGTDSNGFALTYTASGLPNGLSIDPIGGVITGTIASTLAAMVEYTVTVAASDGQVASSQTFTWSVGGVSVTNPGDQSSLDEATVSLGVTATDFSSGTLSYSASGLPTGLSINAASGLISGTIGSTADATGTFTATVTASDGTYSQSQTFDWDVARVVLNTPADQVNADGTTVSLALTADDNIHAPTFSVTNLPSGLSLNATTGLISGTIGTNAHGESPYQVTVTATDGTLSDTESFVWVVTPKVALPNPGPQSNAKGDTVSLTTTATNLGSGTLTYTASGLPSGLSINSTTGLISGTISSTAATASEVTETASNGTYTSSQVFAWNVSALNLPTVAAQDNMDDDVVSVSAAGSYHGSGTLTYTASGLPTGLSINATTGLMSGTVANTADAGDSGGSGPYEVTVTASAGTYTASDTFSWEVDPRVDAYGPGDQTNVPHDTVSLAISADDNATTASTLTYSASGLPGGLSINSTTGLISGTITAAVSGTPDTVTVTASDGTASASATFDWTLAPLSLAAVADQDSVGDATVSLALTDDVAGGYTPTYSASGLPSGLSINSTTGLISGTLSAGDTGTSSLTTVTATAGGVTSSESFTWTVGTVVVAEPADQTSTEGGTVSLTVSAQALSGTLTYSASGLPTGLSINSSTGAISGTIAPGAAANGPYAPEVVASNGTQSNSQTFNWVVNPMITAVSISDQTSTEGGSVSIAETATDGHGGTLSYSATGLPTGLSINASTGLISGTVSAGDSSVGWYDADVTVSDGTYTTDVTFSWNVTNGVTTPPTLTAPATQVNVVGDSVNLTVTATDSDGGQLIYDASGLPDGLTMDPLTGVISGIIIEDALRATPYLVTVCAYDANSGVNTSHTFSWIVNDSALAVSANTISATEGTDTTVTVATVTDADPYWLEGEFVATINWGDGTSDDSVMGNAVISGTNGTFTLNDDHVYASPGTYHPVVELSDGYQTVTATTTATVVAAPLTVTGGFMQGGVAGAGTSGDWAEFTDGDSASMASSFTATINWGDGTSSAGTVTGANGVFVVSGSHNYTTAGADTVTVTVHGSDGASGTTTSTAQIGNIYAGEQATLTVASFESSDSGATAGQFSATINWGDGTSSTGTVTGTGSVFQVLGKHTYATDSYDQSGGVYAVSVTVDGPQSEVISNTKSVAVERPPMSGIGSVIAFQPTVGFSNAAVASFADPDAVDTTAEFTATIYWGDGTSSAGTVVGSNGLFQVLGGHTYAAVGTYETQVVVSQAWSSFAITMALSGTAIGLGQQPPAQKRPIPLDVPYPYSTTPAESSLLTLYVGIDKNSLKIQVEKNKAFDSRRQGFSIKSVLSGSIAAGNGNTWKDTDSVQYGVVWYDKNGNKIGKGISNATPLRNGAMAMRQTGADWTYIQDNDNKTVGAESAVAGGIPKNAASFQMIVVYTDTIDGPPTGGSGADIPLIIGSFTGKVNANGVWSVKVNDSDLPARLKSNPPLDQMQSIINLESDLVAYRTSNNSPVGFILQPRPLGLDYAFYDTTNPANKKANLDIIAANNKVLAAAAAAPQNTINTDRDTGFDLAWNDEANKVK